MKSLNTLLMEPSGIFAVYVSHTFNESARACLEKSVLNLETPEQLATINYWDNFIFDLATGNPRKDVDMLKIFQGVRELYSIAFQELDKGYETLFFLPTIAKIDPIERYAANKGLNVARIDPENEIGALEGDVSEWADVIRECNDLDNALLVTHDCGCKEKSLDLINFEKKLAECDISLNYLETEKIDNHRGYCLEIIDWVLDNLN